jgi:hypothetical protein
MVVIIDCRGFGEFCVTFCSIGVPWWMNSISTEIQLSTAGGVTSKTCSRASPGAAAGPGFWRSSLEAPGLRGA